MGHSPIVKILKMVNYIKSLPLDFIYFSLSIRYGISYSTSFDFGSHYFTNFAYFLPWN